MFSDEDGDEELESEEEMDEQQKMLMEFLAKKAQEEKELVDYETVQAELDQILPGIPMKPSVEQVNPKPHAMPRLLFGKLMPKPEDEEDKKNKKNKAKKAPQRKKDEAPPKPIKWAEAP